jgi:hypothetical protein
LLISGLILLCACAPQPTLRPVQLEFLQSAPVTRASVDAHLGTPSATFDQDRVVAYRLTETPQGYFVVPPSIDALSQKQLKGSTSPSSANFRAPIDWQGITHDLVLAFDESGVVAEYRLIAIHQPAAPH